MSGPLTPAFVMDLERRMRVIQNQEYQRLTANLWWSQVAKRIPSTGKSERMLWLLDTAGIQYVSRLGADVEFMDQVMNTTEFTAKAATAGLRLNRFQLEDHDGGGVQLAANWARTITQYGAYWPQKQVATALRNGTQAASLAYDGIVFFKDASSAHPVNPLDTSLGTYANRFTGAASGAYPGALPISGNTIDVALENLQKAIAYIAQIKMPNGEDPRGLRVSKILVPPALMARAVQLTNAKFIAQAAATGGGGADVTAVVASQGLGMPVQCDELAAGFTNGSDTTYYLVAESATTDELGGVLYVEREPFSVLYHGEMTDAQLARMNEFQWMTRGRNVVGYGHPYLIFRCEAT